MWGPLLLSSELGGDTMLELRAAKHDDDGFLMLAERYESSRLGVDFSGKVSG